MWDKNSFNGHSNTMNSKTMIYTWLEDKTVMTTSGDVVLAEMGFTVRL
jgi:hypothetical protein